MSKFLRLSALKINDSGDFNLDNLIAQTWANFVPREKDRLVLPVLPNPGLVRLRWGGLPTDATVANNDGVPVATEPAEYWGKQGALLRLPKGAIVSGKTNDVTGSNTQCYTSYAGDGSFLAGLSAARVFLAQSQQNTNDEGRFLTEDLPHYSALAGSGVMPAADYIGGDLFVGALVSVGTPYIDHAPITFAPTMDPEFAADVTTLAAAAPRFDRYRLRFYRINHDIAGVEAACLALFVSMQTQLVAAGIDAQFMGTDTTDGVLASLESDIKAFFGIP
jgi:hypothetical protein